MLSLTYVSSASNLVEVPTLLELLADWRVNNHAMDLSGMLLYSGGNIIQTLEGPEASVEAVFAAVAADPRHSGILVLLREVLEERAFPEWSMGFRNISDREIHDIDGYTSFIQHPAGQDLGPQASPAYRLLELFRQNMR